MKKVKNRAISVMLLGVIMVLGLGLYVVRYLTDGGKWVSYAANAGVYESGVLSVGRLTDRNGVELLGISGGKRTYAEESITRESVLHVTGDTGGNIGTGALTVYAEKLIGYNVITGSYSRTGKGETAVLTIDSRLNEEAYKALGERKGAVMVYNYENGEVLCMVSTPSYDPVNAPNIEEPKYEGVYINRGISASYTPGSVFKLVTAAAALEKISGVEDMVFECEGSRSVGESAVTCTRAHGSLTLEDALAVSCNCAFSELAEKLGGQTLYDYALKYGLIESGEIGGIGTVKGKFEIGDAGTAELAWSGVGQYNDMVCPASMLKFVGAIGNGGASVQTKLIKETGAAALKGTEQIRIMEKETAQRLSEMMNYNVEHTYGAENYAGLKLHAKSGTAEVGGEKEPHAWFAGFIRNEDYPLAFVVIIENGGSGNAVAGAAANKVLQAAVK